MTANNARALIHILPRAVADRIAAGEVVERPASVVKELLENAIDAGATAMAVEIREGGLELIRVSDNGSGMSPADAPLAIERFATSKLESEQDLLRVRTLGFRGEALPSIASMAVLEMITRSRDAIEGTRLRVTEGRVESEVIGAPAGTQVLVRGLFYNAPARRKFLKSPFRETELIRKTIMQYALAYPAIAFRFTVDGREGFAWAAATPLERIGDVWGRETAGDMIPVEHSSIDLRVRGYISRPTLARGSREWQQFYVNGRPIRSGLLAVMLERPYAGRLPLNRHAVAVLNIEVAPQTIDVNVHPRKAEVRFYQERAIYQAVTQGVGEALREFPLMVHDPSTDWSFDKPPTDFESQAVPAAHTLGEAQGLYAMAPWHALGQIHRTYILAQSIEGLVIVDQHSAEEQVFFERLTGDTSDEPLPAAVEPATASSEAAEPVQLMPGEARLLAKNLEEYRAIGVEVEPFGTNTFRIERQPPFVGLNATELLAVLLAEHERYPTLEGDALRDRLASKLACVSAIKAGDALTLEQQQNLLDALARIFSPATCPHGRPTFVSVSLAELEQRFLRR
jgi:DNA mismatch repair protein MutL